MKLQVAGFRGLAAAAALVVAAAAVAAGSVQLGIGVAQKVFRPAADKVAAAMRADGTQSYIVQFKSPAAAIYARSTGVEINSTESRRQFFVDVQAPAVQAYVRAMATQHAQFLTHAASVVQRPLSPRFDYHYALNGMAINLTAAQAVLLRSLPNVKSIELDRSFRPVSVPVPATATDTFPSRSWIGSAQLWALPTFNTGSGNDNEGEGVVVADLDTGINAANSSFAAAGADGYPIANPLGANSYLGVCNPANTAAGQPDTYQAGFPCNSKLIGAYTYTLSTGNDASSPQDSEGHGSHTASIAAGDFTTAAVAGITFNLSGVAPHANIIAYDVCDPKDQCSESASVAAVDQAIQDLSALKTADPTGLKGMVINYSIGGSDDPYTDAVDQAFEAAEQAGIYVSVAGGNGGPANPPNSQTPGSQYAVQHLAPWIMTVAAGTHDGQFGPNNLENFSGGTGTPSGTISGQGATGGFGPASIVYAGSSAYTYSAQYYAWLQANYASQKYSQSGQAYVQPTGNAQADAAQCLYPFAVPSGQTFTTPTLPGGAIVLCDRGTIPLVDKADDVKQGGAGAVVIATTATSSSQMVAEPYDIPGTLIGAADGTTVRNWITGSGTATLTAQLAGATYSSGNTAAADYVAGFSSRGPVGTYPGTPNAFDSLIKPDVMTPGVSILGALADPCYTVTPATCPDNRQETFGFLDGTSMATPHSTGAGALLMQLHPGWDPMAIKSALMSTAVPDANLHDQCDAANATANACTVTEPEPPTPQSAGAGRIQVNVAARAGFVLEETKANFDADNPDSGGDPTKINLPSLGNANCQASCTWTRTVTSVQSVALNYTVTPNVPWLSVSPAAFTLNPGASQTLTFTASMGGLTVNQWVFGRVDFTTSSTEPDGSPAPTQHFPVAVFNAQSQPKMGVTPNSFTQALTAGGSIQSQTLNINNTGPGVLNWTLDSVASPSTSPSNPLLADAGSGSVPRAANPVPIVNRPYDNSGTGVPSSFFSSDGHGLYSADTFSMPVAGSVTSINA
ncbi:MAG: S8 family serine peptidase, partial [Gammaproteobacteria bacterium]